MSNASTKKNQAASLSPMIEVAPNRYVQREFDFQPAEMVLCDVVAIDNDAGTYKLVPRSWERYERVTPDLCRKLGLGDRTDTLRRLIRAGFVAGSRVGPQTYSVNLASYWQHYERCAENIDYWDDPKIRTAYWAHSE